MKIMDAIRNYYTIKEYQEELGRHDLKLALRNVGDETRGCLLINQDETVFEFIELDELRAFMVGLSFGYDSKVMQMEIGEYKSREFENKGD